MHVPSMCLSALGNRHVYPCIYVDKGFRAPNQVCQWMRQLVLPGSSPRRAVSTHLAESLLHMFANLNVTVQSFSGSYR